MTPEAKARGFNPDWTLTTIEHLQVWLSLALGQHVPEWPGATDEQLEAVATALSKNVISQALRQVRLDALREAENLIIEFAIDDASRRNLRKAIRSLMKTEDETQ